MSATNLQIDRSEQLPQMPNRILNDFWRLLHIQSHSDNEKRMVVYLIKELEKMGLAYEIDEVGNILVVKGKAKMYPCIVAHMDTVHYIVPDFQVELKTRKGRIIATANDGKKPIGIGGDDKCGIFACLYMLQTFDNIKIAFFTQEESGMNGSNDIDTSWFDDVGYIIQLDRWGRSDLICLYSTQSTVNVQFLQQAQKPMQKYGFTKESGLITDSINLWNADIGVACVNVSCGYYQHHTSTESIDINELWNSILFAKELIFSLGENQYESHPKYKPFVNKYGVDYYNRYGINTVTAKDYPTRIYNYKDDIEDF